MSVPHIPPHHHWQVYRGLLRSLKTPRLSPALERKAAAQRSKEEEEVGGAKRRPRYNACQEYVKQQYGRSAVSATNLPGSSNNDINNNNKDAAAADWQRLAIHYWQLQKDLAERARLYELDSGAEQVFTPQEMSRRAAARAGLQLPQMRHIPDDDDDADDGSGSHGTKK